jgi:hydroxymethylbilane synthase
MTRRVRIGTRGSQLALWQAGETARQLANAGFETELVTIRTTGDRRADVSLAAIGGKGLFIKELEDALARGAIDLAVHSLKDVPSLVPEEFALAAFLERADPRDAWVQPDGQALDQLPDGAVVGTSAPRRRAQLAARFPRLQIADIRGNVDTRIAKARAGEYAGVVLASAGLARLGRADEITAYFSVDAMLPAAGQGIVVVECLRKNAEAQAIARAINHAPSEDAALCERGVLQKFGTQLDCYSAIAVHATSDGAGERTLRAFCASLDGTRAIHVRRGGREARELINAVHDELVAQGAEELLWQGKST